MAEPSPSAVQPTDGQVSKNVEIPGIDVDRELGTGGFADVYGGTDSAGRRVAVKVFKSGSQDAIRLYQREVKVATMLPDCAYRPMFHYSDVLPGGRPYFVMERIQGRSLIDHLVDGWRPSVQEACRIIVDVCAGLESLHELGLVHSDVKPGNIILAEDGRAVIIDFGLVADAEGLVPLMETEEIVRGREFSTDTSEPMLAGTPRYFAPEQIAYAMQDSSDEPAVDTATDIYALGAILYEMLARRPLWPVSKPITDREAMRDYVELRTSGVQPETPLPNSLDPNLAGLVRRCVRHELRDRPRTAKDLRIFLRRYLDGSSFVVPPGASLEVPEDMPNRVEPHPMKTIRRQVEWARITPPVMGGNLAIVDPRKKTKPSSDPDRTIVSRAADGTVPLPPVHTPSVNAGPITPQSTISPPEPALPIWLYNAIWAALGASLALAALALMFDW